MGNGFNWYTNSNLGRGFYTVLLRKSELPQTGAARKPGRTRKYQRHTSTHKWHSETGAHRCGPDVPRFPEVHCIIVLLNISLDGQAKAIPNKTAISELRILDLVPLKLSSPIKEEN